MTTTDDGVGPIDESVLATVADRFDVSADRLRELVEQHQRSVADLPGVEELVYEWRKHFDGAVIARTERTYYLAVPAWVWDEFGDSLSATDPEVEALVAAHRNQTVRATDVTGSPSEGETYVVLDRTER